MGVDIDIRSHNRKALDIIPCAKMELIEGSSIDPDIIKQVRSYAVDRQFWFLWIQIIHTSMHWLS